MRILTMELFLTAVVAWIAAVSGSHSEAGKLLSKELPANVKVVREKVFQPCVRRGMSRTVVCQLLGTPGGTIVWKGGICDIYPNSSFTVEYDLDDKVVKVMNFGSR